MKLKKKIKDFFKIIGPGLITGASDDDPSGITTYSIAGAKNYKNFLWTPLFTLPLMYYVQEMCARIALVTGKGLLGAIKQKFGFFLASIFFILIFFSNTLNIYADLYISANIFNLFLPFVPNYALSLVLGLFITLLILAFPYKKIANILKFSSLLMLSYVLLIFFVKINWVEILKYTLIPKIEFSYEYFVILLAILGTTISPYLFFWQAEEEIEELHQKEKGEKKISVKKEIKYMREDTFIGMLFSNILMFFIILVTGSILNPLGIYNIEKIEDLILVLKYAYGELAVLIFALTILSSTFLVIPILAGGVAYSFCELFNLPASIDKKTKESLIFYFVFFLVILFSHLFFILNWTAIKALFYTAIIYGFFTPIILFYILKLSNDGSIMKDYKNTIFQNLMIYIVLFLTSIASFILIFSIFKI
jgi:Mn2+/Fe2+ NRAMP family transporter